MEPVEHARQVRRWDADAVIPDADPDLPILPPGPHLDGAFLVAVLEAVVDEVVDELFDTPMVEAAGQRVAGVDDDPLLLGPGALAGSAYDGRQIDRLAPHLAPAPLAPRGDQ